MSPIYTSVFTPHLMAISLIKIDAEFFFEYLLIMTIGCGSLKGICFKQSWSQNLQTTLHVGTASGTSIMVNPSWCILAVRWESGFFFLCSYCPASTVTEGEEHLEMHMTCKSVILVLTAGDWNAMLVWVFLFSLTLALSQK